ncbi:hypothetical protein BO79DRAFT_143417, partial [Aspergillus costaricaensis CBS 115574]
NNNVLKLIKADYTWILLIYKRYPYNIQRADIIRLLIIYSKSNIYSDLDISPKLAKYI